MTEGVCGNDGGGGGIGGGGTDSPTGVAVWITGFDW